MPGTYQDFPDRSTRRLFESVIRNAPKRWVCQVNVDNFTIPCRKPKAKNRFVGLVLEILIIMLN
jgi:hypothetical protein